MKIFPNILKTVIDRTLVTVHFQILNFYILKHFSLLFANVVEILTVLSMLCS